MNIGCWFTHQLGQAMFWWCSRKRFRHRSWALQWLHASGRLMSLPQPRLFRRD